MVELVIYLLGSIVSVITILYAVKIVTKHSDFEIKEDDISILIGASLLALITSWLGVCFSVIVILIIRFKKQILNWLNK